MFRGEVDNLTGMFVALPCGYSEDLDFMPTYKTIENAKLVVKNDGITNEIILKEMIKMKLLSKGKEISFDININPEKLFIAKARHVSEYVSWEALTEKALNNPLGVKRLEENKLADKKVCIITDDWARLTPASRIIPGIINRLKLTGIKDENIVFVTASGMHDPMSEADLIKKLGEETYKRFRCVSAIKDAIALCENSDVFVIPVGKKGRKPFQFQ